MSFSRLLPAWTPPQTNREELLDLHQGSLFQVRRSLSDIARINTYLGGARVITDAVWRLLGERRKATILDIGTGSADIPRRLQHQARKRGIQLKIVALDLNRRHLQIAQRELPNESAIFPVQADAFALPLRDQSVDLVIASLFLHHFRGPQIIRLFAEFERVSRLGWAANDVVRDYIPLVFFRLTAPIFARSYLTRHDGAASILRAYTQSEMAQIARESGISHIEVREQFPYRLSVVRRKFNRP